MGFIVKFAGVFKSTRSKLRSQQLAELSEKMNMCSDVQVKLAAEELMSSLGGNSRSKASRKIVDKAEHLLDSVNVADGKYCPLYNEMLPTETTGFLAKLFEKLNIAKKMTKKVKLATYSAPRSAVSYSPGLINNPNLDAVTRFSSLKRFISKYPQDSKMSGHLYEKYYLSTLDADTAKFLRELDAEFGVKVFMDKPLSKAKLLYLREELSLARKAGGASVDYPPLIDITDFDPSINSYFGAYGIAVKYKLKAMDNAMYGRRVSLRPNHLADTSFRHEFVGHYNDLNLGTTTFTVRPIKLTPKQVKEMENAGVSHSLISYASLSKNEKKAVSVQGNISKYSREYVDELVEGGLPRWIERLEQVDMQKYLSQTFKDKKSLETLDQIRESFGGEIPNNIAIGLLDRPEKIDVLRDLINLKQIEGKPLFFNDASDYLDIVPERLETLKKFSKLKVADEHPYFLKLLAEDYEFTPQQVQKLYNKVLRSEQNGGDFDLNDFFDRYFALKSYIREKQAVTNLCGNVTNVTKKSF